MYKPLVINCSERKCAYQAHQQRQVFKAVETTRFGKRIASRNRMTFEASAAKLRGVK